MHTILTKLLNKRKIDVKDLSEEEKKDFDRWNSILTKEEVKVGDIAEFCQVQKSAIESKWENLSNSKEMNERLMFMHTIYSKFEKILNGPKAEREALVKYLTSMLDTPTP